MDVDGHKEQKVFTYSKTTKKTTHVASTVVPEVMTPLIKFETVVDDKKVSICNNEEDIIVSIPETQPVVEDIREEIPNVQIESVIVTSESKTKEVTVIAKTENKEEFVVKKYTSDGKIVTKVDDQVVNIQ